MTCGACQLERASDDLARDDAQRETVGLFAKIDPDVPASKLNGHIPAILKIARDALEEDPKDDASNIPEKAVRISKASNIFVHARKATGKDNPHIKHWRCKCGHSADYLLEDKHPERRKMCQSYLQCSKCGSDIDTW